MSLLAAKNYDPTGGAAVSKSTASLLAMTALDTTNLRVSFTTPAVNGTNVLVKLRGTVHGATTFPQILLGVLDGATVRGRQVPLGALKSTAVATAQLSQEAMYVVSGLSNNTAYTWDAAYAVQTNVGSTGIKYGGPDDTTTDNAMGAFSFEVYTCPQLLGSVMYDPAGAVSKATSSRIGLTAFDTANARITFTCPSSGNVWCRVRCALLGATTFPTILLGVLDGITIRGRQSPVGGLLGTALATTMVAHEAAFAVTGLTPGNSYSFDAAYGVEILLASTNIKYGGPNDNAGADAWGGLCFDIWAI